MSNRLLLPPLSQVIYYEGKGNFAIKKYYKWPFSIFYQKKLRMILDMIGTKKYWSILDFGCGPARIFNDELQNYSDDVIGVDITDKIPNKKFDLIVCSSVLEFVPLNRVLQKLRWHLMRGGELLVASPMDTIITKIYFWIIGDKNKRWSHKYIIDLVSKYFFVSEKKEWFGLYFSLRASLK